MPSRKRQFGDVGENLAEEFILNKGYKILDRNYRIRNLGEIDIVGEKNGKLIFFEVKTRDVKHETNFPIESSINAKKRQRLKRICQIYLADKRLGEKDWQVDGIYISADSAGGYKINHLENIVWEEYY